MKKAQTKTIKRRMLLFFNALLEARSKQDKVGELAALKLILEEISKL